MILLLEGKIGLESRDHNGSGSAEKYASIGSAGGTSGTKGGWNIFAKKDNKDGKKNNNEKPGSRGSSRSRGSGGSRTAGSSRRGSSRRGPNERKTSKGSAAGRKGGSGRGRLVPRKEKEAIMAAKAASIAEAEAAKAKAAAAAEEEEAELAAALVASQMEDDEARKSSVATVIVNGGAVEGDNGGTTSKSKTMTPEEIEAADTAAAIEASKADAEAIASVSGVGAPAINVSPNGDDEDDGDDIAARESLPSLDVGSFKSKKKTLGVPGGGGRGALARVRSMKSIDGHNIFASVKSVGMKEKEQRLQAVKKVVALSPAAARYKEHATRLKKRLGEAGLKEKKMPGDGNCQFASLSDQLYQTHTMHAQVRAFVVAWMKTYSDDYSPFVIDEPWDKYLERMAKNQVWGDHLTLQAAADFYGTTINIISSFENNAYLTIRPCKRGRGGMTRRTIWLSFWAEVHYNSLYHKDYTFLKEQEIIKRQAAPAEKDNCILM